MNGRLASGVLSSGIDWFVPPHVRGGDADLLQRARLVVAYAWTLISLAVIYAAVFFSMNSPSFDPLLVFRARRCS